MPKTTTNLGLPSPDVLADPFTPQQDIEALADRLEELYGGAGPAVDAPAASTVPFMRWRDDKGTIWESDGTEWILSGGRIPRCLLAKTSGDQNIASGNTTTVVTWQETSDLWDMHAANDAAIIVPFGGLWAVSATVTWNVSGGGYRRAHIRRSTNSTPFDGDDVLVAESKTPGAETTNVATAHVELDANERLFVAAEQTSGSTLAVAGGNFTWFSAVMLSS